MPLRVIMLMLDGFRPDYVTVYPLPHLQRLIQQGTWAAEARSVFPFTTTTNQTSFVTGSWPMSTTIPNNVYFDRATETFVKGPRHNQCPTIAEIVREHGRSTVAINHFMLENRGVAGYIRGDMAALHDVLRSGPPDFIVYYHPQTDSVGHAHGPFSPEMRAEVTALDAHIGTMMKLLDEHDMAQDTLIVIASDHGMVPNDGAPLQPRLLQVMHELKLQVARTEEDITDGTEMVYLQMGSAFLYWRNGFYDAEREEQLLQALATVDGLDVYTRDTLATVGADSELLGDIVLVPREGWQVMPARRAGGFHGVPAAGHSTLLFWGCGVRRGHIIHRASIVDIVPTVLAIAGIPIPSTVDGRVLEGVLADS